MNILITSASRKVGLIRTFKNALRDEGGGKIVAVDASPLSPSFYFSDFSYTVPRDSSIAFLPSLLRICKKHNIKLIIPTRDEELLFFSKNIKKFQKHGVIIMVGNRKTIEICSDKKKFIEFCIANNISVPRTYTVQELKKRILFPVFINERFGKGSSSAYKIDTKIQLREYRRSLKNPIVQEYIDEKEYTIDLFADFNGNVISVVPRERIYTFGGESFIGKTFKNKKLIENAISLSEKLGLIGHNTIQCFFDGKKVKFIEVNPRYGGGAVLGFAAGVNTPAYLIQLLKKKKLKVQIGAFEDGLVMLRYTADIFAKEKDLKRNKKQ